MRFSGRVIISYFLNVESIGFGSAVYKLLTIFDHYSFVRAVNFHPEYVVERSVVISCGITDFFNTCSRIVRVCKHAYAMYVKWGILHVVSDEDSAFLSRITLDFEILIPVRTVFRVLELLNIVPVAGICDILEVIAKDPAYLFTTFYHLHFSHTDIAGSDMHAQINCFLFC